MILTPDQRLRVFVSAVHGELDAEVAAVRRAVESLHLTPVTLDTGMRSRAVYRAYLKQCHVFVGVYGERYGDMLPPDEELGWTISALEDQYRLSAEKPRLIYVVTDAPNREPHLQVLLSVVEADDTASYKPFTSPEELEALVADDLAILLTERFEIGGHVARPARQAARPRVPLPRPPTSLIGREDDVAAISRMLLDDNVRLVTLTGVGGIGKTRIALEVAAQLEDRFADGVRFVPLDTIADANFVLSAVAGALGIHHESGRPIIETLATALAGRELLLVLDNFEHVVDAAPDIAELLTMCPLVTLLVTSRRLLRLSAEFEYPVPPLTVPAEDVAAVEEIGLADSIRLFVARSRDVRPDFDLTAANAVAVAEICRRLDGVPLAIELVAARVRLLPPERLLPRLEDQLDTMTGYADLPARQRTLRATVDWSTSLLSPSERRLLARLGTFLGGWDLDAVETICGGTDRPDVLDTLSALSEHSLVVIDVSGDAPRFRMLEPIRQYARDMLMQSGEADEIDARHREYFMQFVRRAATGLHGREQRAWLGRLDADAGNIRALVLRALRLGDAAVVAEVGVSLWIWLWADLRVAEAHTWMTRALDLDPPDDLVRGRIVWTLAAVLFEQGDHERSAALLEGSLDLFERAGDEHGRTLALFMLGSLAPVLHGGVPAEPYLTQAEERFAAEGLDFGAVFARIAIGNERLVHGDVEGAEQLLVAALDQAEDLRLEPLEDLAHLYIGISRLQTGEHDAAGVHLGRALEGAVGRGNNELIAYALEAVGGSALAGGDAAAAAVLIGAAERLRERTGLSVWPIARSQRDALVLFAREMLGEENFADAVAHGHRFTAEAAVDHARKILQPHALAAREV